MEPRTYKTLGRKKYFRFTIGKEEPEEFDILYITTGQILIVNPRQYAFQSIDEYRVFSADVDWIPNREQLAQMLDGRVVPCTDFGPNSSRVETSYRYCYQDVFYGLGKQHSCYWGVKAVPCFVSDQIRSNQYNLILHKFGRYHWDEETS